MSKIFNIVDYGAVGDGVTDCTKAIQQAMDDAAKEGGVVDVPPGEYATGTVHLKGVHLTLNGYSGWGYHSSGVSTLKLNNDTDECLLDITGAFGCTVRGLGLLGGRKGKNIHGIQVKWDKYDGGGREDTPAIEDCRVAEFTGDALHLEHIWAFSLRHSMLIFNGGSGLYVDGWDGFICDNIFNGNELGGMRGGNVAAALTFTGNRIEWNRLGGIVVGNGSCINITGNYFDRAFGPSIAFGGKDKHFEMLTANGNIFRRSGAYDNRFPKPDEDNDCHVHIQNVLNATISGNSMQVAGDDFPGGNVTPDYGVIVEDCQYCMVRDNSMGKGAMIQNIVLKGDNSTCMVDNNIESLGEKE